MTEDSDHRQPRRAGASPPSPSRRERRREAQAAVGARASAPSRPVPAAAIYPRARGVALLEPGPPAATPAARRTRLVGRARDVTAVADLLRRRWMVTVTGAPGVGKSALVAEVVAGLERGESAVAVVALGAVDGAAGVSPAVAGALGVQGLSREALGAALAAAGAERLVVVLDDCDHVRAAAAGAAQILGVAGVGVLATSQRRLEVPGEGVRRVAPLSVPGPTTAKASDGVSTDCDAVRLFRHRAQAVHHGVALAGDADRVAAICRLLDGLPLAVELAAGRIDVLSPGEILARLERDPVAFLVSPQHGGAAPHRRSLWGSVQASYGRLSAPGRVLWARLSVFTGGFTLEAAQTVCAGDEVGAEQTFDVLSELVTASLVESDTTCSPRRYRLLEPLRRYARQRLDEADEGGALAAAHAQWCQQLVDEAGDPRQRRRWLKRLTAEHANIGAAWRWAFSAGERELAVRLGCAHAFLCRAAGRHHAAGVTLERAASLAAAAPGAAGATALCEAAGAAVASGDFALARLRIDQAVSMARGAGDVAAEARALALGGLVDTVCGHNGGDLAAVGQAVALARTADDELSLTDSLIAAGRAHLLVGEPREAHDCFAESLALARRRSDEPAIAYALTGVGRVAVVQGAYPEAQAALTEGRALAAEGGEAFTEAVAAATLGELARRRGDEDTAKQRFRACARLAREASAPYPLALALLGLGRTAHDAEETHAAHALFEKALAVAHNSTLAHVIPACMVGLAQLEAASGDQDAAERLDAEALEAARRCGDKAGEAHALSELGRMASAGGDQRRAASLHHESLTRRAEIGEPAAIADSLQALAGTAAADGRFTLVARLLGAAHRLREVHGCGATRRRAHEHDAHVRAARRELGTETFDAAWSQGAAMSTEEAIAHASKGRGPRKRPTRGWEALTPAEQRVVALAQQGLRNAEIAERLLVSRRTVDAHLTHVYTKLEIHSRRQLTAAAVSQANENA